MLKRVLFTGFQPFDGDTVNPALEAVRLLHGRQWDDVEFVGIEIPTVFGKAIDTLRAGITTFNPDVVICVGQAGGRAQITPERVAINVDDAPIGDNEGNQPIDEPVFPGGPAAYWSTLPIKKMTMDMNQAGIPASVSNTAGTFVCNHIFYGLMHELAQNRPGVRGGFIHIPYMPEQVTQRQAPSMSLDVIVRGLELCGLTSVRTALDIQVGAGTEC